MYSSHYNKTKFNVFLKNISARKPSFYTGVLCISHRVVESAVAEIHTHLHTGPEESSDEVITLQNALLLKLREGRTEKEDREVELYMWTGM